MKHSMSINLLSRYANKICTDSEKIKVESHISQCAYCKKKLLLLNNSNLAIKQVEKMELSQNFDEEFNKKLTERLALREKRKVRYWIGNILDKVQTVIIPPMPTLAKSLAVIFCVVFVYNMLTNVLVESPYILLAHGNAMVYCARKGMLEPAVNRQRLFKGDVIYVKKDSYVDIKYPDKYIIRVKESSEVRVAKLLPRYIPGRTVYFVKKGKALISIREKFRGSRFIVETPDAIAAALGTEFLVDVSMDPTSMTRLGVFEGKVAVTSLYEPIDRSEIKRVLVNAGEATEIYEGQVPLTPRQLFDKEWQEMVEFYKIGKKVQVALIISNGRHRTRELLRPCLLYISEAGPRTISESLEETLEIIDDAIKTNNREKHLLGIARIERVLAKYSNAEYEPQLLLFIGSYYNYLTMYQEAIETFQEVVRKYPRSTYASIALYAIGILYDESLNNRDKAKEYYGLIIKDYPKSPEAEAIRDFHLK